MRILSELEEFGRENIPTLINTVTEPSGADAERVQLQEALLSLLDAGLVNVAAAGNPSSLKENLSKEDSAAVLANINDHLVFDSGRGVWTGGAGLWPEIVATDAGKEQAWELLDERGYQWWRRNV